MEHELLGWPPDGPQLRLDYREFSYAGKFVMTNTGKAIARNPAGNGEERGEIVAAVAFNEDRTDPETLWLRYVTVRRDRRGEGIGPELVDFVRDRALDRGYDRLKIAVNNPYAYEALHRSGFGFTGETTGIAELVLAYPSPADPDEVGATYRRGLEEFNDRDLSDDERSFVAERLDRGPPETRRLDSP